MPFWASLTLVIGVAVWIGLVLAIGVVAFQDNRRLRQVQQKVRITRDGEGNVGNPARA